MKYSPALALLAVMPLASAASARPYASQYTDADNIKRLVHEVEEVQAAYRLTHPNAHLSMWHILRPQQVVGYALARSYDGTESHRGGLKSH